MKSLSKQDISLKEQELTLKIQQYYTIDMSALKDEIQAALNLETTKIDRERTTKLQEIQSKFQEIVQLADHHVAKGNKYETLEDAG